MIQTNQSKFHERLFSDIIFVQITFQTRKRNTVFYVLRHGVPEGRSIEGIARERERERERERQRERQRQRQTDRQTDRDRESERERERERESHFRVVLFSSSFFSLQLASVQRRCSGRFGGDEYHNTMRRPEEWAKHELDNHTRRRWSFPDCLVLLIQPESVQMQYPGR